MKQKTVKILICGEDVQTTAFLQRALDNKAYCFEQFKDIEEGIEHLFPGDCQILLLAITRESQKGKLDGLRAIPLIRKIDPNLSIIAIAHDDSLELERKARVAGVFYYLLKPLDTNEVRMSVTNAVSKYERLFGNEKMDMDFGYSS